MSKAERKEQQQVDFDSGPAEVEVDAVTDYDSGESSLVALIAAPAYVAGAAIYLFMSAIIEIAIVTAKFLWDALKPLILTMAAIGVLAILVGLWSGRITLNFFRRPSGDEDGSERAGLSQDRDYDWSDNFSPDDIRYDGGRWQCDFDDS